AKHIRERPLMDIPGRSRRPCRGMGMEGSGDGGCRLAPAPIARWSIPGRTDSLIRFEPARSKHERLMELADAQNASI
ncbi:MAG: hypothetical protein ACKVVP_17450, partial [Chloroflexota bacterium]